MPKLTIVVGMGGSGKSYLCKQIAEDSRIPVKGFSDATLTSDHNRRAGFGSLGEIVARLLGKSEDCVMDESHLVDPSFRERFLQFCNEFLPDVEKEWIFFEADVLACINNVYRDAEQGKRRDRSRYQALDNQHKVYEVPDEQDWPGRKVRPVYRCINPRFNSMPHALQWLRSMT